MKRILSAILCAVLLLSFGAVAFAQEGAQTAPQKFLVLGDSIAAGSGVQDKNDAYAWIVAKANGYDLTNYGAGENTSADLRRKVTQDPQVMQAIREADVIAVSIGGNDLLHAEEGVVKLVAEGLLGDYSLMQPVLAAFSENFPAIVEGIRALNPNATLIVQTLYNPAFPLPSLHKAYAAGIQGINKGVTSYHAQHPDAFILADVYTAFEGRYGLVFIDMTHPSAAGHAVIAAVLQGALDGKTPQLPPAKDFLALLAKVFAPALFLLDKVLIGVVVRAVYGLVGLFV